MLMRTARGFAAVLLLGASVVGLIVVGSLPLTLDATSATEARPLQLLVALLDSPIVLLLVASLVVLLIYRAVPSRRPSWRAAGIPAALVGAMIVVLTRAFVFLVPRLIGVEALAGSLASAFVTLAWLSLTFQALLLGAAWVRVRNEGRLAARLSALEGPAAPAELGGRRE